MGLPFSTYFPLRAGRAHEVCGAGAAFFAFALSATQGGPILWIRKSWQQEMLNPTGFAPFLKPDTLLVAHAKDQTEVLALGEEALRSGAIKLVIMDLHKPVGLTEGRRLQLAAKEGHTTALCLIPDGMGSNAAETRWQCQPVFDLDDSTLQEWKLIKNKSGTNGSWYVRWDRQTCRITVVSPAGKRPGFAGASQ